MTRTRPRANSEALSAFFDNELGEAASQRLKKELEADPALRQRLAAFRGIAAALRVPCSPDPGFVVRHRRIRDAASFFPRWTWRQFGVRLAYATSICLFAAGVSLWQGGLPETAAVPAADSGLQALEEDLLAAWEDVAGPGGDVSEDPGRQPRPLLAGFAARPAATEPEPVLHIALGPVFPLEPEGDR